MLSTSLKDYLFIFISLFLLTSNAFSNKKTISIVAAEYDKFTQTDGKGIYWDIVKDIYSKAGYQVKVETFPYSRSQYLLQQRKIDIVVGAYYEEFGGAIYPDRADMLDRDKLSVIYLSGSIPEWRGMKSLFAAKVGWPRGYRYEKYLDVDISSYEVSDAQHALSMMRLGRLDFYIDSDTEMELVLQKNHIMKQKYKKQQLIDVDIYPAFRNDKRGRKLLNVYEKGIKRLKSSGRLLQIYKKYGVSYSI